MKLLNCILLLLLTPLAQAKKSYIDFRSPGLQYGTCAGSENVYYEKDQSPANIRLSADACRKFLLHLSEIFRLLPRHAKEKYYGLNFFIMLGETSPRGGHNNGMRYVRAGGARDDNGYDDRWNHGVVVYSSTNLLYLTDLWTKKAIVHELAHAWHLQQWPQKYAPIYQTWQKAVASGRYTNVTDIKGRRIPKAYALTNQLEYFAELSAIYFVGNNYTPQNRAALQNYDPDGYALVQQLWSVD